MVEGQSAATASSWLGETHMIKNRAGLSHHNSDKWFGVFFGPDHLHLMDSTSSVHSHPKTSTASRVGLLLPGYSSGTNFGLSESIERNERGEGRTWKWSK